MDTEERLIAPNDYRYALNCRVLSSDEDNVGIVENMKGNEQMNVMSTSGLFTPDPKYKVIGSYQDNTTHAFFYFLCDTEGDDHRIVSNFFQNTFWSIAEGPYLAFSEDALITSINLVIDDIDYPDGILYWTDNLNQPRKLDVKRGFYTTTTTASIPFPNKYFYLDSHVIKAILEPPTNNPGLIKGIDETRLHSNYIKGNIWQFKYRYVYRNNGKSAWSPISDTVSTKVGTYEQELYSIDNENCIEVKIDTGSYEVKSIEVAVRKTQDKEDFYLVGVLNKDDSTLQKNFYLGSFSGTVPSTATKGDIFPQNTTENSPAYFIFKNNEIFVPINLQESIRLFDDVPQLAKCQELIDGNRLTYGNIVNGYDPVETDVDLDVVYQEGEKWEMSRININASVSVEECEGKCNDGGRPHAKFALDFEFPYQMVGGDAVINIPDDSTVKIQVNDILGAVWAARCGASWCGDVHISTIFGVSIDVGQFIWNSTSGTPLGVTTMADLVDHLQDVAVVDFKSYAHNDPDGKDFHVYPGPPDYGNDCAQNSPEWWEDLPFNFTKTGTDDFWRIYTRSNGQKVIRFQFGVYNGDHLNTSCGNEIFEYYAEWGGSEKDVNFAIADLNGQAGAGFNYWIDRPHYLTFDEMNHTKGHWTGGGKDRCGEYDKWDCMAYGGDVGYHGKSHEDYNVSIIPAAKQTENNTTYSYTIGDLVEWRGFKSGAEHGFGIVYYDKENRSGAVNKCGEIYVPLQPERGFDASSQTALYYAPSAIRFNINHTPPNWATHYQIVYTGSKNIIDFIHLNIDFVRDETFDSRYITELPESQETVGSGGTTSAAGYQSIIKPSAQTTVIKMDMESLIHRTSDTNNHKIAWSWAPGDRVRFIRRPNGTSLWDYEIVGIEEDVSNNVLYYILGKEAVKDFFPILDADGQRRSDVFVEIYRPEKQTDNSLYYEFCHRNTIGTGSDGQRIHNVNFNDNEMLEVGGTSLYWESDGTVSTISEQNQSSGSPAIGYLSNGDIHWRSRAKQTGAGNLLVEDFSYSDYFDSFGWGSGRPNAFLPDFKRMRRDSTIFYSEPYIANTKINGLSTFYADVSFQEYDKRFNSIQKLHSINDSLIILQEDKVSRAMVSRDVIFDASGEQNVAISKNVLSPAVPYVGDYGICRNPESFASFGFRSYFFDVRRGAVMRLSQDGLTPISEARMKNFFTDYCQEVADNNQYNKFICYGAYDDKFDEYVISAPNIIWSVPCSTCPGGLGQQKRIYGFTVGFNEVGKRWNSFYSYSPGWLDSFNTGLISFTSGAPWKHNSEVNGYNTFYGNSFVSQMDFPSNASPDTNKIYNNIAEESTDIWEVEINTRNGQSTTITTTEFTNGQTFVWQEGHGTKENVHHAVIKGDINSDGGKIEGDRIRDTSVMASLTLPIGPAQSENTLFSVKFSITPSGSPDLVGNVR